MARDAGPAAGGAVSRAVPVRPPAGSDAAPVRAGADCDGRDGLVRGAGAALG
jgi:hypothetical protein